MTLDPLDLPLLSGRIAIAAAALTHAMFATFIVGTTVIAAVTATIGYLTDRREYQRLAHQLAFTLVLMTGTVSFLGVALVFCLNIFWPRFWHTLFQIMFWPFLLEAALFLGEAVFAYAWYYLWDWAQAGGRRLAHLSFAWLAALSAVAAMFMIDLTASFMLTPRSLQDDWINILNPTMIHLHLHRWVGNLVWAGFANAAVCAMAWRRSATDEDRAHYAWAGRYCFAIGFGALLLMPVIGYQYMLNLRYGEPQAFQTLMLGERSWLFNLVALLYSLLVLVGSTFILRAGRAAERRPPSFDPFLRLSCIVIVAAGLLFTMPYYLDRFAWLSHATGWTINPIGKMQPFKYFAIATLIVFGAFNWLYFLRAGGLRPVSGARAIFPARLLVTLAVLALSIYLAMGWSRETARAANGYLLYGAITLGDERPTYDGAAATQPSPLP